jgi:hypothetical protein
MLLSYYIIIIYYYYAHARGTTFLGKKIVFSVFPSERNILFIFISIYHTPIKTTTILCHQLITDIYSKVNITMMAPICAEAFFGGMTYIWDEVTHEVWHTPPIPHTIPLTNS